MLPDRIYAAADTDLVLMVLVLAALAAYHTLPGLAGMAVGLSGFRKAPPWLSNACVLRSTGPPASLYRRLRARTDPSDYVLFACPCGFHI
jgi:hypothetical protein